MAHRQSGEPAIGDPREPRPLRHAVPTRPFAGRPGDPPIMPELGLVEERPGFAVPGSTSARLRGPVRRPAGSREDEARIRRPRAAGPLIHRAPASNRRTGSVIAGAGSTDAELTRLPDSKTGAITVPLGIPRYGRWPSCSVRRAAQLFFSRTGGRTFRRHPEALSTRPGGVPRSKISAFMTFGIASPLSPCPAATAFISLARCSGIVNPELPSATPI